MKRVPSCILNPIRKTGLVVCLLAIILICSGAVYAPQQEDYAEGVDNNAFTAYTDGNSCQQVGKLMMIDKGRNSLGLLVGAFMTGVNYQKERSTNVTAEQLLDLLSGYCKNNPKDTVTKAMIALDIEIDKGLKDVASVTTTREQKQAAKRTVKPAKNTVKSTPTVSQKSQPVLPAPKAASRAAKSQKLSHPAKAVPGGVLVVQVMSTQDVNEALKQVKTLKDQGFPAFIQTVNLNTSGVWNQVLVGSYDSHTTARQVAELLVQQNHKTFIRQYRK